MAVPVTALIISLSTSSPTALAMDCRNRSLYYGEVDMFLGMRFVESNLLPKSGTTRTCVAFSASAITLGIWEGIFGRVTELPFL
jgi:hypothetical protein